MPTGTMLFESLNRHVLEVVRDSGLPFFRYTESEQSGNTFGARICHALREVFDMGYESVIVLGNDSPQVSLSHLKEAERALKAKTFVLGPAVDGGCYLLGVHRAGFDDDRYLKLPWQQATLAEALCRMASLSGKKILLLPPLQDLDTPSDIRTLIASRDDIPPAILALLLRFLRKPLPNFGQQPSVTSGRFSSIVLNKGSPVSLS